MSHNNVAVELQFIFPKGWLPFIHPYRNIYKSFGQVFIQFNLFEQLFFQINFFPLEAFRRRDILSSVLDKNYSFKMLSDLDIHSI